MKAGNTVILLNFIGNFSNSSLAWILTAIHFGDLFDNKYKKNLNILLNWKFNGWAKYKNYRADNKVNLRIKNHYKGNVISPKYKKKSIVLEGGAIDVNGKGLLLTTKECLLSKIQQRNSFLKIKD